MAELTLKITKSGRVSPGQLTKFVDGVGTYTLEGLYILAEAFKLDNATSYEQDISKETVKKLSAKYGSNKLMLLTTNNINPGVHKFAQGRLAAFALYQATT